MIEETTEIDELPENNERLLKKPEIKRRWVALSRQEILRLIEETMEIDEAARK